MLSKEMSSKDASLVAVPTASTSTAQRLDSPLVTWIAAPPQGVALVASPPLPSGSPAAAADQADAEDDLSIALFLGGQWWLFWRMNGDDANLRHGALGAVDDELGEVAEAGRGLDHDCGDHPLVALDDAERAIEGARAFADLHGASVIACSFRVEELDARNGQLVVVGVIDRES